MSDAIDAGARAAISSAWGLGPAARFAPLGNGLINRTFQVDDDGRVHVLQQLNTGVFRAPAVLMRNCGTVCAHLGRSRAAGRYDYAVLALVPTLAGALALESADGGWWRMFEHLAGTRTHETADDPQLAGEAGRAFGAFARALGDLAVDAVGEVIPGFHDPAARYAAFLHALNDDRCGRAHDCRDVCADALAYAGIVEHWQRINTLGLPRRVVHNDCKLNNLLFDATGRAICVIDLDTVMPGSTLFDFGDLARTLVCPLREDAIELDRIDVRLPLFAALAQGYVHGCADVLGPLERDNLVFAARMVTGIMGLRFLTDHLEGDRYFRIERRGHNLDRARNQFALFAALGRVADDLQDLVARVR